jgi:hypothetical protein
MWDINIWSDENLREMKTNVIVLMNAAGNSYGALDLSKSVPEMLETFLVGTEKRKAWKERSPPKPSELGPIKDMKFPSTAKIGKIVMRKEQNNANEKVGRSTPVVDLDDNNEITNHKDNNASEAPAYRKIWSMMEAAGIVDQGRLFIGHQLLQFRANVQDRTLSMHKRSLMDKQSLKEWVQLKKKSIHRSMNSTESQRSNLSINQ